LIGHNIDGYDNPALEKLYGFKTKAQIFDTLVMTRLAYPNLFDREISSSKKVEELGHKHGSHSLEAWGSRLKEAKIKFGAEDESLEKTFETWSEEMQLYCEQDTKVNYVLWQRLVAKELSPESLKIEHDFNRIIQKQMLNGIQFNVESAKALRDQLVTEVSKIEQWAKDNIQPTIIKLKTKEKVIPFNIGSTDQVADYFITKYGWQPTIFTPTKKPKVDGDTLASLSYPEAKIFSQYNERTKILGFLQEGKNSWLKSVRDTGRIHGYVNSNGAVTGRVLMSKPNLSQVPAVRAYMGKECRGLFGAREGYNFVDCDASGLELRCLAHYMYPYDNGDYAKTILEGDIHTKNQEAAGLETRDQAKTFIYALCYGAGQEKLGAIVNPTGTEQEKKNIGRTLKSKFYTNIPALKELTYDVQASFNNKGYLKGIDGRFVIPREGYKSLNTLLQGAGAIAVKLANNIAVEKLTEAGIDFTQVAFIHDEILLEVKIGQEHEAGEIIKQSIHEAGLQLGFRISLTGEYKIGKTWADVH
jgi:DNA polymerase I-like protein with 3'-5' exonuclease and polymerase domains